MTGGVGWICGKRLWLLINTGRRTGFRQKTLLEVVDYDKEGPEVVVMRSSRPNNPSHARALILRISGSREDEQETTRPHVMSYAAGLISCTLGLVGAERCVTPCEPPAMAASHPSSRATNPDHPRSAKMPKR